ncbi:MAG: hypothetical protein C0417_01040 [Chlorobiaceae bacterium]|nr:hypothetical protein [Chlorobiaceae bacterium]
MVVDTMVFAGTQDGVFRSTINSNNWLEVDNGLASKYIRSFASINSTIFVGTNNAGVYRSTDYGSVWEAINEDLKNQTIQTLAVIDTILYAGTYGSGVWKLKNALPTKVEDQSILPFVCSLSQNYPNPFNPTTNFQFSIANSQLTIMKVYDVLGREVETLVNELLNPGTYNVKWDATKFSSGVYFYRLQSGKFTDVKKMILAR